MSKSVTIWVTPEEKKLLEEAVKCDACGHLDVLHNKHCCSFCTVPDCLCYNGHMEKL